MIYSEFLLGMQSIPRSPLAFLGYSLLTTLVTMCLRSPSSCVSTQLGMVMYYNVEYTIQETTCPKSVEAVTADKCPLMECEFAVSLDRLYLYLFLKSSLKLSGLVFHVERNAFFSKQS